MTDNTYIKKTGLIIKFVIIHTLLLIISSNDLLSQNKIIKNIITDHPENFCFSITNKTNLTSDFSFSLNHKFFASINHIKESVYEMSGLRKDSLFYYAWEFVCNNTYYHFSFINHDWSSTTMLYLNSIGFGLCGRQALFLSKIWNALGYQSRIVSLNGHIVPEVLYKNRWNMLDPGFQVYYLNNKNEIASVKQLRAKPRLITKPKKKLNKNIYSPLRYTKELANIYRTSKKNNFIYNDLVKDEITDLSITLPPNASFEFPGYFYSNATTAFNTKVPYYANCRLKIPPAWTGLIYNRLIIADIKGNGIISIDNQDYKTSDTLLSNKIKLHDVFIPEIFIKDHTDTIEIIYFINPILSELYYENEIILSGLNVSKLEISSITLHDTATFTNHIKNEYFFYGEKRIKLLSDQIKINPECLSDKKIKCKQDLFEILIKYFNCSENENSDSINKQIVKFSNAFNKLPQNCNFKEIFNIINLLPRELIFYDIRNATEEIIYNALFYLSKTD